MSGGSYDYLCYAADVSDIGRDRIEPLTRMVERLRPLDPDASMASTAILAALTTPLDPDLLRLWQAVEWRDSCDWTDNQLAAAVAEYRSNHQRKATS